MRLAHIKRISPTILEYFSDQNRMSNVIILKILEVRTSVEIKWNCMKGKEVDRKSNLKPLYASFNCVCVCVYHV